MARPSGPKIRPLSRAGRRRPRAAGAPVRVLGEDRTDLVPGVAVDDGLVLARVGGALVLDLADVGRGCGAACKDALVERLAALGAVPGGVQLLHQLGGRADLQEALEDVPDEARLGVVDHELSVPHVVAQRRVAAHPQPALA